MLSFQHRCEGLDVSAAIVQSHKCVKSIMQRRCQKGAFFTSGCSSPDIEEASDRYTP